MWKELTELRIYCWGHSMLQYLAWDSGGLNALVWQSSPLVSYFGSATLNVACYLVLKGPHYLPLTLPISPYGLIFI